MKQYITLEEAKMQIPGFVDDGEQDEYITGCILDAQAALDAVASRESQLKEKR